MDSSDMTITYRAILERAKQDALERMPELPKPSDIEPHSDMWNVWFDYIRELEDVDAYEIAHESSQWDWVIYYHRAMELCQAVPSSVLHDAESQWQDMGGQTEGLFELACTLACIIVEQEIADAVEQAKEELIELAQTQIDNSESV